MGVHPFCFLDRQLFYDLYLLHSSTKKIPEFLNHDFDHDFPKSQKVYLPDFISEFIHMTKSERYIRIWLWSGIVLVAAMVIIGGITRLTGSGLSIVEWKPITGVVPPLNQEQWQQEFNLYKEFPQYQKANLGMTLPEFKEIFFWEYVHRLLGRLIGVVFMVPFLIFYFKGWFTKKVTYPLLLIFILGGLQGFMGWYMVKSGLNNLPYVSHLRLALHQGIALLLIAAIFWLMLSLNKEKIAKSEKYSLPLLITVIAMMMMAIQIVLGSLVAGLKAGFSYTNFPLMGDGFFPPSSIYESQPLLYNGAVLQFIHRWFAFGVLLSVIVLWQVAKPYPNLVKNVKWLLLVTLLQISLGIITLLMAVPVVLGVVHQFMAIILLLVLIRIIHLERYVYPATLDTK